MSFLLGDEVTFRIRNRKVDGIFENRKNGCDYKAKTVYS